MNLQQLPNRLDEQLSAAKALDFDYAALDAETRTFVQQGTSEIPTLMRRAIDSIFDIQQKLVQVAASQIRKNYVFGFHTANSIFDIRQKLIQAKAVQIRKNYVFGCSAADSIFDIQQKLVQVTAFQIRKNYVFGCSAASALNSRLSVSFATVAKVRTILNFATVAKVDSGCQMFTL